MSVMANADTHNAPSFSPSSTPSGLICIRTGVAPSEPRPSEKSEKRSLVELKNGKIVLRQKILSFEKMSETMQDIVKFRDMLEQRLQAKEPPLTHVPDEHKPVFAKLVQESDKTLQALSKHVQQQLLPAIDEDEEEEEDSAPILPLDTVEDVIKSLATRINYGLESPTEGGKVPAAWHIWRWEVSNQYRTWLPKNAQEKVENRCRERQQAKIDVRLLFEALPEDERNTILGSKPGAKYTFKVKNGAKGPSETAIVDLTDVSAPAPQPPHTEESAKNDAPAPSTAAGGQQQSPDGKGPSRPKKPVDPEKAAEKAVKEKERLEKRAAKAEREKKEQAAQAKSRSLMANFFGKTKPAASPHASPSKPIVLREGANGSPAPTTSQSDFQRAFKPFALKKDAELAPVNWFRERRRRERRRQRHPQDDVIVIDDDENDVGEDVDMADAQGIESLHSLSHPEQVHYILSRLPAGLNPPRRPRQPTGYKTYWPISVRGLMTQLTEAEVAGEDNEVRRLLALLRSRRALPAKVLVFAEDARPGYFGTSTRSSREVGPRTPFARDVVAVDYGYDSGAEWAEEDAGDADDVVEGDAEDEEADDGEADSDLDSWLVDDDEVEDPGTPIEERPGTPEFELSPGAHPGKRKKEKEREQEREAEKERGGTSKKRRVVVPLVPFTKGPEWENVLGRCRYKPFNQYRIQLFNDTPFPIDPFTFVSQPVEQAPNGHQARHTSDGFAIPALPSHLANSSAPTTSPGTPLGPAPSSSATPLASPSTKRGGLAPKTAFPDAHLPHLLARIDALATSSLHCIVETVYRELQAHRVKKNAIEAKVREVGEKSRERKVWVVRAEVKAQHGIA
ncbi:hypothetical protein BC628DRAFT_1352269 [Trametes gibbosa]|nr:hypothetical protein BC628DRAFT_1352269 [Trametes gibbosa]